jgi:hypothetical protein
MQECVAGHHGSYSHWGSILGLHNTGIFKLCKIYKTGSRNLSEYAERPKQLAAILSFPIRQGYSGLLIVV